jgi:hypothetical protein
MPDFLCPHGHLPAKSTRVRVGTLITVTVECPMGHVFIVAWSEYSAAA